MKAVIFLIVAIFGINTLIEAREMTPEEARERAQIVTMGGD